MRKQAAMTNEIWENIRSILVSLLGESAFTTWIEPLKFDRYERGVTYLTAPNSFIGNWVSQNYGEQIMSLITERVPGATRLDFSVAPKGAVVNGKAATPEKRPAVARNSTRTTAKKSDDLSESKLDERYTFDNFVVGKPNELAHAAARRVAEGGPTTFNPLFLHGGVGLGKTHLMNAIAHNLQALESAPQVLYLSAEQFMYRFVRALRFNDTYSFKELFRSVDVLMVDDVQFIAGKESTQEEFFHTFNALVDQNKQIVISADRAPGEIKDMEERIRSRLQCGLIVDLHPTDYELRLGILQTKSEMQAKLNPGIAMEDGVLEFLARRISQNVRVLEGALNRLFAFASLVGRPIDLDLTHECLSDVLRASERKVTVEEIMRKVAAHYNVRMADMLGPRRVRTVSRPRQIAMFLAKKLTTKSFPEIGRQFGGRDHTTVMHAVKRIDDLSAIDSQVRDEVEHLRCALEA